jgi:opacity protein-like surface antigen
MFDWAPNQNNNIGATLGGATAAAAVHNRWVTTATGKFGHAWDRILVYAKGGGAWVGTSNSALTVSNGAPLTLSAPSTNWGWTAGIGFECALWTSWSARVEYDYVGLNRQTFTVASGAAPFATDVMSTKSLNLNLITAGLQIRSVVIEIHRTTSPLHEGFRCVQPTLRTPEPLRAAHSGGFGGTLGWTCAAR